MAKSHRKKATLRRKTVPALGAGVRCVARRAGILADPARGKKVLTRPRLTAGPRSRRKFSPRGNAEEGAAEGRRGIIGPIPRSCAAKPVCCGDASGLARVLHGYSEGYAGLCRAACCRLTLSPSGIGCSTGRPPGRDPHDKRVRIGHSRLAASKACVPTRGIDVGALGGRVPGRCAGCECRPARAFLSSGRRRSPLASGRSSEHIEEVSRCSAC